MFIVRFLKNAFAESQKHNTDDDTYSAKSESESDDNYDLPLSDLIKIENERREIERKKNQKLRQEKYEAEIASLNLPDFFISYFTTNRKAIRNLIAKELSPTYCNGVTIFPNLNKQKWYPAFLKILRSYDKYDFEGRLVLTDIINKHQGTLLRSR
jgi:hypothetical protein